MKNNYKVKKIYKVGDIIGNNNCKLIELKKGNKLGRPKHLFLCGKCGEPFHSTAAHVVNGNTKSCGCLKLKDYTAGEKIGPYGHTLIKEIDKKIRIRRQFVFRCSFCSSLFNANISSVVSGHKGSCGCVPIGEKVRSKKEEIRSILSNMKGRCYNVKNKDYRNYGGRGITICDRWTKRGRIENFIEDMGYKPIDDEVKGKYTIDRIDNNKGYYKDNCRWATNDIQALNKRHTNNLYNNITYDNSRKKWIVKIKKINIGRASTRIEAINIYNNYIDKNSPDGYIKKEIPNIDITIIEDDELLKLFDSSKTNKENISMINRLARDRSYSLKNILQKWNISINNIYYIDNIIHPNTIIVSTYSDTKT